MKITYPRNKRKVYIPKNGAGTIYLLFGHGVSRGFWLQDFWDIPYSFRNYKDAVAGAKKMHKKMKENKWDDDKPLIMKLLF